MANVPGDAGEADEQYKCDSMCLLLMPDDEEGKGVLVKQVCAFRSTASHWLAFWQHWNMYSSPGTRRSAPVSVFRSG